MIRREEDPNRKLMVNNFIAVLNSGIPSIHTLDAPLVRIKRAKPWREIVLKHVAPK